MKTKIYSDNLNVDPNLMFPSFPYNQKQIRQVQYLDNQHIGQNVYVAFLQEHLYD